MTIALACLAGGGVGCAGGSGDSVPRPPDVAQTPDPTRAFAPLVEFSSRERYRPMSARWFIERSVLRFAHRPHCGDRTIAVGRTLPEQRRQPVDWIAVRALGRDPTYHRNPRRSECELDFDLNLQADDLTRPHDPSPLRAEGLRAGEGFYLDLVDAARTGPERSADPTRAGAGEPVPVYAEGRDEGDSAIRLTYWLLYGAHAPPGRSGDTHEGDWERVDVLLTDDGRGGYAPVALQLWPSGSGADDSTLPDGRREISWSAVPRFGGTHPVLTSGLGTHSLTAVQKRGACRRCERWRTWEAVLLARNQLWYGFGGAWGEPGPTSATTGPLGPRGL